MSRGLPQGSILSPVLYNILANSVPQIPQSNQIIYADDKETYCRGRTLEEAERKLQEAVIPLEQWLVNSALTAEISKCKIMCWTLKRLSREPNVNLNGNRVEVTKTHKSLGLLLDGPHLTWAPHIEHLRVTCTKRLDVMRRITGVKWGASRELLLDYYIKAIRSKIEYGCSVYGSASKTVLDRLNTIQNTALRISTGAFKTSPILCLEIETGVKSLTSSRQLQTCKQFLSITRKPTSHPLSKALVSTMSTGPNIWTRTKKPFIIRALQAYEKLGFPIPDIWNTPPISPVPPWENLSNIIRCDFPSTDKPTSESSLAIRTAYNYLSNTIYKDYSSIFTDGSSCEVNKSTAAAMFIKDTGKCEVWRLPKDTEITNAELFAIMKACSHALASKDKKMVIYTDSLSALQLLISSNPKSYRELVIPTQRLLRELNLQKESIILQWIPSHKGIPGNTVADQAAKMGLQQQQMTVIKQPESTLKKLLSKKADQKWLEQTTATFRTSSTHLRNIRDNIQTNPWMRSKSRILDTALLRARIGHCGLNGHLNRINLEDSPDCEWCGQEETIAHMFLECPRHHSIRADLKDKLSQLGLTFSIKNILGGGNYPSEIQFKAAQHVKVFLRKSGRLQRL